MLDERTITIKSYALSNGRYSVEDTEGNKYSFFETKKDKQPTKAKSDWDSLNVQPGAILKLLTETNGTYVNIKGISPAGDSPINVETPATPEVFQPAPPTPVEQFTKGLDQDLAQQSAPVNKTEESIARAVALKAAVEYCKGNEMINELEVADKYLAWLTK